MDIFEYTAVLTSIIIGLGIAHLLRGFAGPGILLAVAAEVGFALVFAAVWRAERRA